MRIVRILTILLLMSIISDGICAQTNRRKQRTESASAKGMETSASSTVKKGAGSTNTEFDMFMSSLLKDAFVVVRQDYQLVDEEEGDVINSDGKNYWKRGYSMGARIGDSDFLVSGDVVTPWAKDGLSSHDRHQPMISATAFRSFDATEFEPLDFTTDGVTEYRAKRLYATPGSEMPGLSVTGVSGRTGGYAVWAIPDKAVEANDGLVSFSLRFVQMTVTFTDGRSIYDVTPECDEETFGGFFLVPLKSHPGCVDFGIAGMFQRIGGVWKLVSVPDGTELKSMALSITFSDVIGNLAYSIDNDMQAFVKEIGL